MKIGCCTNMIATAADGAGVEFVEKLADFGFDYIELPLAEMTALPEEDFATLVGRVNKSGIRCETCNNFFPKTMRLTGANVVDAEVDAYIDKALARARRLGVDRVVFGSGPAKNVPEGFPLRNGYLQVVDLLRRAAPVARAAGITIVIEPLRKGECNLINSFAEGCALARDVDDANVRVLVDYYHLTEEKEPAQNIREFGREFLRHVHFARCAGRSYPDSPEEDNGYQDFFAALRDCKYDLRVSLEAYSKNFDGDAPLALAFLRRMTQV